MLISFETDPRVVAAGGTNRCPAAAAERPRTKAYTAPLVGRGEVRVRLAVHLDDAVDRVDDPIVDDSCLTRARCSGVVSGTPDQSRQNVLNRSVTKT
jgi:hypothetical protein